MLSDCRQIAREMDSQVLGMKEEAEQNLDQ
jgi:hypothetical protein